MRVSTNELLDVLLNMPSIDNHPLDILQKDLTYYDDNGTKHEDPKRVIKLIFHRNENEDGWFLQLSTTPVN